MKRLVVALALALLPWPAVAATYAIVNTNTNIVENTIEYPSAPSTPPPGFPSNYIAVPETGVSPGWTYNGGIFTNPNPPTPPTPAQQAQAAYASALSAGLTIASSGTPSVNATYALDASQQSNIANLALYIAVNNRFPGGLSAVSLRTTSGTVVSIPTTTLMTAMGTAIADYIAQLDAQLLIGEGGGTPSWPSASKTIN